MKPVIQLSIDNENLETAIEALEETQDQGITWIEIDSELIETDGSDSIRRFRQRFPEKKIVVNMKRLYFMDDIEDTVKAGADIISLPEIKNNKILEEHIENIKGKNIEVMANLDWISPIEEKSRILEAMGVDYIMINIPDERIRHDTELIEKIKKISSSIKTPIGIGRNISPESIGYALSSGAKILVISRVMKDMNKWLLKDKMEPRITGERGDDENIDDYFELGIIETDLENIKKKFRELGKQREEEKKRIESLEKKMKELNEIKKKYSALKKELGQIQKEYEKEKEELESEKKTMRERIDDLEKLRDIEKEEIKREREKIKEEFRSLNEEWSKLRDKEKLWNEKQKNREEDFRRRQEEIWEEWEDQQRKRLREYSLARESDRERIDKEMLEINNRWDEINEIVNQINKEKAKLSEDKEKIRREWSNIKKQIEELKVEGERLGKMNLDLEENRSAIVEELERRNVQSMTHLPKLVSRVSDIYKEKEEELRKLKSQRLLIDEKLDVIDQKWRKIEELEKEKSRDQKLIDRNRMRVRKELSKIEKDLLQLKKEHEIDASKELVNDLKRRESGDDPVVVEKKPVRDDDIETESGIRYRDTINSLINLVSKEGEIKLEDAAKILNVDKHVVERWSKLLEEKDVIIVDKRLFGGTILREGMDMHKLT